MKEIVFDPAAVGLLISVLVFVIIVLFVLALTPIEDDPVRRRVRRRDIDPEDY